MASPQCLTGDSAAAKAFLDRFDVSKTEHPARRAIWYFLTIVIQTFLLDCDGCSVSVVPKFAVMADLA